MTGAEKRLVERAVLEILPILEAVGAGFYSRLVDLDPTLRALVPADGERRAELFREALGVLLALLDSPRTVRPLLGEIGARLWGRGVPPDAYATAGQAFLEMLGLALVAPDHLAMQAAWANFYAEAVAALEAPVWGARAGMGETRVPRVRPGPDAPAPT